MNFGAGMHGLCLLARAYAGGHLKNLGAINDPLWNTDL
jgi:hypothetical protein